MRARSAAVSAGRAWARADRNWPAVSSSMLWQTVSTAAMIAHRPHSPDPYACRKGLGVLRSRASMRAVVLPCPGLARPAQVLQCASAQLLRIALTVEGMLDHIARQHPPYRERIE